MNRSLSRTPGQQAMFKPGKSFLPNQSQINITDQRILNQNGELETPKPFSFKNSFHQKPPIDSKDQLLNPSPIFASGFAKDKAIQNAKKRMYSEISNQMDNRPSPYIGTPYMTFDDNSTIKPNQNTVVRNPTLMSLGIGRDDSKRGVLNKTNNIKPINLNLTGYKLRDENPYLDIQVNDDSFLVDDDLIQNQTFIPKRTEAHLDQLSKKDINLKCLQVQHILDHIYLINSNPDKNDIALVNSRGLSFEYQPLQYIVSNQLTLPQEIQTLINKQYQAAVDKQKEYIADLGIFEQIQVGYFFQNQNLYLWAYGFPGRQEMVAHQKYLNLNKIRCQLFNQVITCVAVCEPLPEMMAQAKDNKILIVSTSIELQIFIIKRDNDSNEIQLIETEYKIPTDGDFIEKIVQFKKNNRIFYGGSEGHVNEINLKSNKIDQFLQNISLGKKKLKRNDHQATSFLEKLLPSFIVDRSKKSIIDIKFDESRNYLYSLCQSLHDDTYGQAEIEIFDLGIFGNQFQKVLTIKQYQLLEAYIDFQKISIFGKGFDILKLSENFKIVFMQPLQTNESQISHLLLVTEVGDRIYLSFDQIEIDPKKQENQINNEAIVDFFVPNRFKKDWIIREVLKFPKAEETEELFEMAYKNGFFKCIGGNISTQSLQLNRDSLFYDNQESCLLYTISVFDEDDRIPQTQSIKFNFIKKNESTFTHMKQFLNDDRNVQISEIISQFDLAVLEKTGQGQNGQQMEMDSLLNEASENIYQIKVLNSYRNQEIQNLLGLERSFKDYKGQVSTACYKYFCQDIYEKQPLLDQRKFQVISDLRVLEVMQLRPIDQLVMILHTLTRPSFNNIEDFEDFVDLHSIKEVCTMLIQIIADRNGKYLFSRRVESMICGSNKGKNGRQAQSQPRQHLRNLITGPSQASYHQSPIRLHNQKQSYQSTYFDVRTPHEQKKFIGPNFQSEYIIQKCNLEVISIAKKLLSIYGDCINIQTQIRGQNDLIIGEPVSLDQFSCNIQHQQQIKIVKHLALYEYIQRLLRPFIDINIMYNTFLDSGKEIHLPSIDSLAHIQERLADTLEFITRYYPQLQGETLKSEEFLDYEQNTYIRDEYLRQRVILIDDLKSNEKYAIEVLEQNSIINLKLFLQRCIHATQLINLISYDNDRKKQAQFWGKLKKDQQTQISQLAFRDLLNNDNNNIIKDILNILLDLEKQTKPQFEQRFVNQFRSTREGQLQLLYNQMFTKEEVKAFKGERLLIEAINEQDQQRKDQLLEMSLRQMCEEPTEVDLPTIAPLLVQLGNFTSLVEITLNKIIVLKNTPSRNVKNLDPSQIEFYIDQAYQTILQVISAIDQSLRKENDSKFIDKFIHSKDQTLLDIMIKKLSKVSDIKLKVNLRNNIMRKIEQVGDILLLAAIYEYQLKKPTTIFDLESFPKICKEAFEKICDNAIQSDYIQKEYLESLIILLCKKGEGKRLSSLVLKVCNNDMNVYIDGESIIKQNQSIHDKDDDFKKIEDERQIFIIDMDERRKMIDKALTVLTTTKINDGVDTQLKYQRLLQMAQEKVNLQLMIIGGYQEQILALREQVSKNEDKINSLNSKRDRDHIQQLEQQIQGWVEKVNHFDFQIQVLNSKLHEIKDLLLQYIEKDELYEIKLVYNITQEKSKQRDGVVVQKEVISWVRQLFELYQGLQLQNKIKEKLESLNENERKQMLIPRFMSEASRFDEFKRKDRLDDLTQPSINRDDKLRDLSIDLKKLLDGHTLKETRFWFYELCFQMEQLKLKPSQLIDYLSHQPSRIENSWEPNQMQRSFKYDISNDDQLYKYFCLMKLWIKRIRDAFKDQSNLDQFIQNSSPNNLEFTENPLKILHQDLITSGKQFYTIMIMNSMRNYVSDHNLSFHKDIQILVDQLLNDVMTNFQQILISHGVTILGVSSQPQTNQVNSLQNSDRVPRTMNRTGGDQVRKSQSYVLSRSIQQQQPIFNQVNSSIISQSSERDAQMEQPNPFKQPFAANQNIFSMQNSLQQQNLSQNSSIVQGESNGFNLGGNLQRNKSQGRSNTQSRIFKNQSDNLNEE